MSHPQSNPVAPCRVSEGVPHSLYDADYEHSGTSYPNVVRMSMSLFKDLKEGDHAIIRHFQMDEKRNMYCLPKNHTPFPIGERGKGGFGSTGK